jgi:hypothetical protein
MAESGRPSRAELQLLVGMVRDVDRELRDFRAEHQRQHEDEARARVTSRRWLIGTLIAVIAVIESPLIYLVAHVR